MGARKKPRIGVDDQRAPRPWTREEIRTLTTNAGSFAITVFERALPTRSRAAIKRKLHDLFGGGITRGTQTIRAVEEATGYSRSQILRASRALGQRIQRSSSAKRSRVMFFDDQVKAITRWLERDYWCAQSHTYACVDCGQTETAPKGLGLCVTCYDSRLRACRRLEMRFSEAAIREYVRRLRATYEGEAGDWLDAFAASLDGRCVLSRNALSRLIEECDAKGIR